MGTTPQKVRDIIKISQEPVSLESPIGDEGDSQFGDFIEDHDAVEPVQAVSETLQCEELDALLTMMTSRERRVIELRFGLKGEQPRTLEEVGQAFGVTRERIRQIEAKTISKAAQLPRLAALEGLSRLTDQTGLAARAAAVERLRRYRGAAGLRLSARRGPAPFRDG